MPKHDQPVVSPDAEKAGTGELFVGQKGSHIERAFDRISHQWILQYIPMNKNKLGMWCNQDTWKPEAIFKSNFKKADRVHLVRYADDAIVTGRSKELLEDNVKPLLRDFLQDRGLRLHGNGPKEDIPINVSNGSNPSTTRE